MEKKNVIDTIMSKIEIYGRLVTHSSGKLILYDCPSWPGKASSLIFSRFPNISIAIEQNTSSLSGYIIIFDEISNVKSRQRFFYSLSLLGLVFCLLGFGNYYMKDVYKILLDFLFSIY